MTDLQILYFLKVAEHMSYTKAARELFLAQPSLSKQISALERELGAPLFDRSRKNRMTLTPAGELFQKTFRESATRFRDTLRQVELQEKDKAMELRIGVGAGWDWGDTAARCTGALAAQWPEARLSWQAHTFLALYRGLMANELDVIFRTQTGLESFEGLEVRPVAQVEATVYYSASQPPAAGLGDFRGQPFHVLPQEEAPFSTDINRGYFAQHRMAPQVVVHPNRESIFLALAAGQGFAVFDNMMLHRENPRFRALGLGIPISVCAVWRTGSPSPLLAPVVDRMAAELTARFGLEKTGQPTS